MKLNRNKFVLSVIIAAAAALAIVASVPATAQRAKDDDEGVKVRRASFMRNLVSAATLEKAALQQYGQLRAQATGRNSLVPDEDQQAKRVQRIAQELLPHSYKWNRRAKDWRWEVMVVSSSAALVRLPQPLHRVRLRIHCARAQSTEHALGHGASSEVRTYLAVAEVRFVSLRAIAQTPPQRNVHRVSARRSAGGTTRAHHQDSAAQQTVPLAHRG